MLPTSFFKKLIEFEGEYSNHPNDPGGETIYGIAEKKDKDSFKVIKEHYNNGNKEQALLIAKDIYDKNYYQKSKCNSMESVILSTIVHQVFDMAVNMGVKTSIKILQQSINKYNKNNNLTIDGAFGNVTLEELKKCNNIVLNNIIVDERINYYKNLCVKNPKLNAFINGWINRSNYFKIKV